MKQLLLATVAIGSWAGAAYAGGCPQQAQGMPSALKAQQAQGLPQAQQAQQAQGMPSALKAQQAQGTPVARGENTQVAAADCPR